MKSRLRTRRKLQVEKARTSATAVRGSTTRFLEADTHHQDRANMWDKRQPSNNVLEEDQDIWDPRGRASAAEEELIGREVLTGPALERMNQQMVSSTR